MPMMMPPVAMTMPMMVSNGDHYLRASISRRRQRHEEHKG
jgi:hypothetical protein